MPWISSRISCSPVPSPTISLVLKNWSMRSGSVCLPIKNLNTIVATLESTSVYSIHIANFCLPAKSLCRFHRMYCINPKMTANYRKSFVGLSKTDPLDSFLIADFARVGRVKNCTPWRGSQFLASKASDASQAPFDRMTHQREDLYDLKSIPEIQRIRASRRRSAAFQQHLRCNVFRCPYRVLSVQDIIDASEEDLLRFSQRKVTIVFLTFQRPLNCSKKLPEIPF